MIKYIWSMALVLQVICSCSKDSAEHRPADPLDGVTFNADGSLNLSVNLEIPGMMPASTRALDGTPAYDGLSLYLLVFDEDGLKQLVHLDPAEQESGQTDDKHGHESMVTTLKSTVRLEPTEKKAVVHLIATDQPDFGDKISFGLEDAVVPSLYTTFLGEGDDKDFYAAYWQRRDLGCSIPSEEQLTAGKPQYDAGALTRLEQIKEALAHVPMIRNFCRVSVKNTAPNFTLTGLYVVNTVDRGSVAPYVADNKHFVDYYDEKDGKYVGKSYADISAQGHIGSMPDGVSLINRLGAVTTFSEGYGTVDPVYFYERPARTTSSNLTYAIVRGNVTLKDKTSGQGNEKTLSDRYYKIDLGRIRGGEDDPVGIFDYYNLLRNFDYQINLKEVESEGYESLDAAAAGAVFNNFSASVEARSMNSISDGEDMIFVNQTSFVFLLAGQTKDLKAQFRMDIGDGTGGKVHNELLKIKYEDGDVIEKIEETIVDTDAAEDGKDDWNLYTVTGKAPDPDGLLKQQTVYVYRGQKEDGTYGLYREIIFMTHLPWSFVHIDTFPGLWMSLDDMPEWGWSNEFREIGQSKGSPLTLFFELPAGLPQALFPLEFVIESDRQNIQNAYAGNSVVRSVPAAESLFARNEERGTQPTDWMTDPSTTRIQYVKTVTWEDYNGERRDELVGTGNPIIRCRFLTITDLAQSGVGDENEQSVTTLRVYNEYFGRLEGGKWLMFHEDGFTRDNKTSDPTPKVWDFSTGDGHDGLTINGTYNEGGYYAGVTSFSFTHAYPGPDERIAELFVTTGSAAKLTVSASNGASVDNQNYVGGEAVEGSDGQFLHRVKIRIPKSATTTQVRVTASPSVNVYKVEYYPRGLMVPEEETAP